VIDVINELRSYGIEPFVADPLADAAEVDHEYGLKLTALDDVPTVDAVIVAAPHREIVSEFSSLAERMLGGAGVVIDIKAKVPASSVPAGTLYWAL